jgi:antitoxin MazE
LEVLMRVANWGNSLAVRLPAALVDELGLKAGDEVEIRASTPRELELARKATREEAIEILKKFKGRLPADFKFDREEANAR